MAAGTFLEQLRLRFSECRRMFESKLVAAPPLPRGPNPTRGGARQPDPYRQPHRWAEARLRRVASAPAQVGAAPREAPVAPAAPAEWTAPSESSGACGSSRPSCFVHTAATLTSWLGEVHL